MELRHRSAHHGTRGEPCPRAQRHSTAAPPPSFTVTPNCPGPASSCPTAAPSGESGPPPHPSRHSQVVLAPSPEPLATSTWHDLRHRVAAPRAWRNPQHRAAPHEAGRESAPCPAGQRHPVGVRAPLRPPPRPEGSPSTVPAPDGLARGESGREPSLPSALDGMPGTEPQEPLEQAGPRPTCPRPSDQARLQLHRVHATWNKPGPRPHPSRQPAPGHPDRVRTPPSPPPIHPACPVLPTRPRHPERIRLTSQPDPDTQ